MWTAAAVRTLRLQAEQGNVEALSQLGSAAVVAACRAAGWRTATATTTATAILDAWGDQLAVQRRPPLRPSSTPR